MNKTTSFLFAVAMAFSAMSQTVDLRFTGQLSGGSFVCLDSVKVENITRAWSETLVYPDTVLSFTNVGINDVQGGVSSLSAYPNPMGGLTTVSMSLAQSGTVTISVYDLSGRSVAWHSAFLEAGAYAFNVSLEAQQVYLLAVATPTGRQTLKLVNTHGGSSNAVSNLIFTGVAVAKGVTTRPFGMGDAMKYTGYATFDRRKLKSAAKHQCQDGSEDITLVFDEASVMPQGALTGVFSVSQNGRVHFSSGNLQWSATGGMMSTTTHTVAGAGTADGTWRFAPNQWDVIGESNANISSSYNGWIDLFGWGTSGYGNKHPYLIEQRPAFYVNGVNSISGTNYDWGVFNAISNGGDAPDLWRTLTFDEMQYLLFYRHTLSGIIFAKATLENTAGLVLFPDNWDSTAFAINNANDGGADFSVNNIVQSDWISILEPAGCVFLPAAGYRYGTQINDVGVSGNVWLSTYYDERDAHSLRFTGTGMRSFGNFRYCGGSVRLVCDETAILPIVTTDSISNLDDHSARTGGNVVSDGGTPVTERGVCWSTSPNPTIFGNHTTNGTGTGAFTISLSGLSANTVYYLRAYATNRVGTSYGQQMVFTTLDIPTVTTAAMSTIIDTTATGGGRVTFDGNTTVTARGVCWDTTHNPTISGNHTTNGGGTGSFTSILTQLIPSTTYYVRAYATNIIGTAYGAELSFTTLALPSVSTTMASNVSDSGATSGGRVTNDGGTPVTARGVCWSTSQYPTVADSYTIDGSGTGIFTSLLPRLIPGTTYYVRAYATNAIGTSYGAQVNFTTLSMPIVVTVDTSDITDTSLTVSGRVNSEGGLSVTARGFCWDTLPNPTIAGSHSTNGIGLGNYSTHIGGLSMSTVYYVRAYATNALGTSYGTQIMFKTDTLPMVRIDSVTHIADTSINTSGAVYSAGGAAVSVRGVCWSTSPNPTIADSRTIDGNGTGRFNSLITGLAPGTTYYLRPYCSNAVGVSYGNQMVVTTYDLPTVVTTTVHTIINISATAVGNVTADGGTPVTVRGICWDTLQNPTIGGSHTTNGSGLGTFSASMTVLIPGTTYYVRAYATNTIGTAYGQQIAFMAHTTPTVVTDTISNITGTTALCGGTVVLDGDTTVTTRGICWDTLPNPVINGRRTADGSGLGHYSSNMIGLAPNTTYYVRAYATNAHGTVYGAQVSFTTPSVVPTVTTTAASNITSTSATLGGNVTSDGGATVTARGVCWGTSPNPTVSGSHTTNGSGVGTFTSRRTGLTPGTTYYVRAYATNSVGTGYGNQVTFKTSAVVPTVTTAAASNITSTSATTGGNVTSDGGATVTARGVCWSTSPNPTVSGSHTTDGSGTGTFTSRLAGLTPGTYYVRAYATNSAGTGYGNQVTFTTSNTFSVSANDRVVFSPGNLQWSAKNGGSTATTHTVAGGGTAAGTWRFAPNQWDTIGANNRNISSSYSGWIDLFGWGTSGYNNKYPYMTNNTTNLDYGNGTNNISGTNYDWGVYNAIYNPKTQTTDAPGTWRTLTEDELIYLIHDRNTPSGISYAKATVNGVPGLILVPDNWSSSTYALNSTNTSGAAFSANVLTAAQWATLENAGCAFLPAAGRRLGTSVSNVGSSGDYWSTTTESFHNDAYYLNFGGGVSAGIIHYRYYGRSVRLVRTAQ